MSSQTEDNFIGARRHVEFVIARLIGCGRAHSIAAEFDCGGFSERPYETAPDGDRPQSGLYRVSLGQAPV
jgi:hypothetical protein